MTTHKKESGAYDVCVLGGGLIGLLTTLSLLRKGFKVVLVEGKTEPFVRGMGEERAIAINKKTCLFLKELNIFDRLEKQPIKRIFVSNTSQESENSASFLKFSASETGDEQLGFIARYQSIEKELRLALSSMNYKKIKGMARIEDNNSRNFARILCKDTKESVIRSEIVCCAVGRSSAMLEGLGFSFFTKKYNKNALVGTIRHSQKHSDTAYENFLQAGPFAVLPLKDPHTSSVVWTEEEGIAKILSQGSSKIFLEQLKIRCGEHLGEISLVSEKFLSHPLALKLSYSYVKNRIIALGDAAHSIHPIAGQGFNLGVRDVIELVDNLDRSRSLGMNIGSCERLNNYEKSRIIDSLSLSIAMDILDKVFISKNITLSASRKIGLDISNALNSFKKHAIDLASGVGQYYL